MSVCLGCSCWSAYANVGFIVCIASAVFQCLDYGCNLAVFTRCGDRAVYPITIVKSAFVSSCFSKIIHHFSNTINIFSRSRCSALGINLLHNCNCVDNTGHLAWLGTLILKGLSSYWQKPPLSRIRCVSDRARADDRNVEFRMALSILR